MKIRSASFVLMAFAMLLWSCAGGPKAGGKETFSPAGNWDAAIKGTPLGDIRGTMTLNAEGDNLTGTFSTQGFGSFTLRNINLTDRKVKAALNYEGFDLEMEGEFKDDDSLEGFIYGMGDAWPLAAKRIKP
jgi:hypothetical protein